MNAPAAPLVARLRAEIADLRQQLAAAEEYKRDAERYRWLRDKTDAVCLTFSRETAETDCYSGTELDAAIDAARTK